MKASIPARKNGENWEKYESRVSKIDFRLHNKQQSGAILTDAEQRLKDECGEKLRKL